MIMPNYCWNTVTITGNPERLKVLAEAANKDEFFKAVKHYDEWSYTDFVDTYGTKWEISPEDIDLEENTLTMYFQSAWAPPLDAYNLLMDEDDIESIYSTFSEPGMDFCGIYEDGNLIEESITELAEMVRDGAEMDDDQKRLAEEFDGDIEWALEWMAEEAEEEEEEV
jgi:hypothetical protein